MPLIRRTVRLHTLGGLSLTDGTQVVASQRQRLALLALLAVAALMSVSCLVKDNAKDQSLRAAELARFEANVNADDAALVKLFDAVLEY